MRRFLFILALLAATLPVRAEPVGQRFVSIVFHDIVDDPADLESDAVLTKVLVQFFDWLKGTGWTAVSLDDLTAAARGVRPLPDKAILITFDDGRRSLYTRAFPLLQAYHYPAVAALIGDTMEDQPDGTVAYGDQTVPRTNFISWAEAREMQASGLLEFASHSYDLHRGIQANPQGNMTPAAITWRYDPATGTYDDDAQYRARIAEDLSRSRAVMAAKLGKPPRAIVWPFGRYTGPALDIAKRLGFSYALTLRPEPAYTGDLYAIHRYFPSGNPNLGDLARNLRFEEGRPTTLRIACLTLDALAAPTTQAGQDEVLGRLIEGVRALGANAVVIDAGPALPSPDAPLREVYFPTRLLPMRRDVLGRATWQIRTRGGANVYLRVPLPAAVRALGEARMPDLFADMTRYTVADGIVVETRGPFAPTPIVGTDPGNIRANRAAVNSASFDRFTRLGLAAYRAAASIDPRQRLMLEMAEPVGPPNWADIGLLPPSEDVANIAALADRLRAEGWLRPDVAGRVALSLPSDPERQIDAIGLAQRQGASAFALCPAMPTLPPPAALAATFSAATYPYRP